MKTLDQIRKDYLQHTVKSNKDYYYPVLTPPMAMRYILDCLETGGELQAIEGFDLWEDGIRPDQYASVGRDEYGANYEAKFLSEVCAVIGKSLKSDRKAFEVDFVIE